jgi:ubiquinone/menaquinone biosynthesis C-methylase UbiE
MKLNHLEFLLMNNPLRAYIQENYELPAFIKHLGAEKFDSVLEIGCGNGNGTRLIRKYFNPLHITAIDLDEKMIRIAQRKNQDPQTVFQVMDAAKLSFADQSFDAIFDFGIIHHIPNWKTCIAELKRVLKNNGKLLLEDLSIDSLSGFPGLLWKFLSAHPYDQMFSSSEFEQYLMDAGFAVRHLEKSNPLKMIKYFFLTADA